VASKIPLKELYAHVEQLDHKFLSPQTGKAQTHWACICLHCKSAAASEDCSKKGKKKQPVKMAKYRKNVEAHLKNCVHYLRSNGGYKIRQQVPLNAGRASFPTISSSVSSSIPSTPMRQQEHGHVGILEHLLVLPYWQPRQPRIQE
jgi:hypothetical protein